MKVETEFVDNNHGASGPVTTGDRRPSHLARELRELADLHWRLGYTDIAATYHARALMIEAGVM